MCDDLKTIVAAQVTIRPAMRTPALAAVAHDDPEVVSMHESGPQASAAHTAELLRQAAMANLQLLALLEVVHAWTRADAADLSEAADQTRALCAQFAAAGGTASSGGWFTPEEGQRVAKAIESAHAKLERLAQLTPVQARDAASVTAISEGLRKLQGANDALRVILGLGSVAPPSRASHPAGLVA